MKLFSIFLITCISIFFSSCDLLYPSKKVLGKWNCVSWTVAEQPSKYNIEATSMEFKDNDFYEATITGVFEKGTFYVEGDKLLTTAENEMQIITHIDKITKDSLVLSMNRGGTMEQIVFKKQP